VVHLIVYTMLLWCVCQRLFPADQVKIKRFGSIHSACASHSQVIDGVIHKYEEGFDGAAVFEEYEKGLQALLSAYTASSPGEHFQLAQQDSSKLMQACQAEL